MNKKEIWKDIPDYYGIYQASNLGNIKSLERSVFHPRHGSILIQERLRKFGVGKDGRLSVTLSFEGKNKLFGVAVIIAKTFLDNPKKLPLVNHKDGNLCNNSVDNLEYISARDMAFIRKKKENLTSDCFGVWFDKSKRQYFSSISINGKSKRFGGFETEKEAQKAYINAYLDSENYIDTKFKIKVNA